MKLSLRVIRKLISVSESLKTRILSSILISECKSVGKNCRFNFPIYSHGLENVLIGDNFHAGERLKLRTFSSFGQEKFNPEIVIGDNVNLESDCHISAINSIIIEDNVLIASFVYISDHSHGQISSEEIDTPPLQRPLCSKGGIRICKNAWLGERVIVLPGVTIGEGAIIGAGSVVTHDIPPFTVAVGSPARVIKSLKN